jgi:hypothetical protein
MGTRLPVQKYQGCSRFIPSLVTTPPPICHTSIFENKGVIERIYRFIFENKEVKARHIYPIFENKGVS